MWWLVAAATRNAWFQEMVRTLDPSRGSPASRQSDEVVAIGAAVQAGILTGELRGLMAQPMCRLLSLASKRSCGVDERF